MTLVATLLGPAIRRTSVAAIKLCYSLLTLWTLLYPSRERERGREEEREGGREEQREETYVQ